ncbi:MAG: putative ATP-grasp-modified RiPP [Nocardiopsaceae bacterium]|nr:putative ATP-grasp-modified RiPP [Nocardiopsaceae bacterium]
MANDLSACAGQFPLEEEHGTGQAAGDPVRPFGLRYATAVPASAIASIDFSGIRYDEEQQIAVVTDDDGTLIPAMKHTSTRTKTSTASHDRQGDDSDTDATGT